MILLVFFAVLIQYCSGCLLTVEAFANITSEALLNMQRNGAPAGESINSYELAGMMCDNKIFNKYKDFVKYSCIKMLEDKKVEFLEAFSGTSSIEASKSKRSLYEKGNVICTNLFDACSASVFTSAETKRTECNACPIIAEDLYRNFRSYNYSTVAKQSPKMALEETCKRLGYYHQPYIWLEEYCDDLIEDSGDQVVDILKFRLQVEGTGMRPSESLSDAMCKELHPQCYKKSKKKKSKLADL